MRRWPLLLLLAAGLTFLASLYLPWQSSAKATIDGWDGTGYAFGSAAALFALGLVVLAAAAFVQPGTVASLPLARCGLLVGGGAVAVGVDTWYARRLPLYTHLSFGLGYGAYVGLVAGAAAVVGALALRRAITRRSLVVAVAGATTLVALVLPWGRFLPFDVSVPGYFGAAAAPAVAAVAWAPVTVLLFYGGIAAAIGPASDLVYGTWIGLGLAAVLALLAFRPRGVDPIVTAAALLFVTTLYFKWQAWIAGWTLLGAAAAALALAIVALSFVELPVSALELAVGFALLVATQGFASTAFTPTGYELRLAAHLGFASAAVLFGAVLFRSRALRPPGDRTALRVCAVLAAVVYLAVSLVPTWHVLPGGWASVLLFIPSSWLGIAGVLLAVRVAGAWLRPTVDTDAGVLLPLVLLALIALDLIRVRTYHLNWGGRIVVAMTLLLALLGWLEQRGGLENFRVPELFRVDRL